jgi:hypothetical protein
MKPTRSILCRSCKSYWPQLESYIYKCPICKNNLISEEDYENKKTAEEFIKILNSTRE